jgi:pantoate--beta-alanine ligase
MIIYKSSSDIARFLEKQALSGETVGFVPTMGALHEGHIRLVRQAVADNNLAVCSIFVNPTQFNDPKDFEKYPVTIDQDIRMLVSAGCDVLFLPSVEEIYPQSVNHLPSYPLGYLETILEGKYRPGHFQGVCQVVDRLLQIVRPQALYMGRKDYQQCMVIKKLLELNGMDTKLIACDTVREADGLAMSSRNMRLDSVQREKAVTIHRVLVMIRDQLKAGSLEPLKQSACQALTDQGFRVDYVEICRADDLMPLDTWDGQTPLVALVAAHLGQVRLIDNMQMPV